MTDLGDLVHQLRNTSSEISSEQLSETDSRSNERLHPEPAFTVTQTAAHGYSLSSWW